MPAVDVDAGRSARSRRGPRRRSAASRPSVIYHCAGVADVHALVAGAGARAARQRPRHAHLLEAARELGLDVPRARHRLRAGLPAVLDAADRRRIRSARRARTASASSRRRCSAARIRRCRSCWSRPFNHAGPAAVAALRDVGLRAADRRHRSRTARAGPAASATSTRGATSPTCATRCAPIERSSQRGTAAAALQRLLGSRATACGDLLDILLSLSRGPRPRRDRPGAAAAQRQPGDRRQPRAHHRGHGLARRDSHRADARGSARLLASALDRADPRPA